MYTPTRKDFWSHSMWKESEIKHLKVDTCMKSNTAGHERVQLHECKENVSQC